MAWHHGHTALFPVACGLKHGSALSQRVCGMTYQCTSSQSPEGTAAAAAALHAYMQLIECVPCPLELPHHCLM